MPLLKAERIEYQHLLEEPGVWDDARRAAMFGQKLARHTEIISTWDALLDDCAALEHLIESDGSDNEALEEMVTDVERRFGVAEFEALFNGEYDARNAIVAIHAGTGGTDAMDWAEMLLRMYTRFCERQGWKVVLMDTQYGNEAGLKSAAFEVRGKHAYGYLKAESGVHRLVRISPFDSEKMRHTSFALVEVVPDLGDLEHVEIKPEELRIDVFRAGGKGGQSVNTTDSAVRITHMPTGIVVSCQNERSQSQNKEMAMRHLKAKLHKRIEEQRMSEKKELRGEYHEAAWGNQIRSYVLNPYRMVKDHRTHIETHDVQGVLDGDLMPFIESMLRKKQ